MSRERDVEVASPRAAPRIPRPDASPPRPRRDTLRPAATRPQYTTQDHRWARPHPHHVYTVDVDYPAPWSPWYTPWYTHWWVHPYYRWHHATGLGIWFDWYVDPWDYYWYPPVRIGWTWVPGYYVEPDWWSPGYYAPVEPAPEVKDTEYEYVPGWWVDDVYIEGYWRVAERPNYRWVDGAYRQDGTYAWGHWEPLAPAPEDGYVWEPGIWDGEAWLEGFWRPEDREGYRWVRASLGADGIFRAGYWEPLEERPGFVWIPGWFDGNEWVDGYWAPEDEVERADPESWKPPAGWDRGRDATPEPEEAPDVEQGPPLALPVEDAS